MGNKWARVVLSLLLIGSGFAGHADVQVPQIPENQDVRIIVDISGSMKNNDPENLRQPAVRLLARMLPANSTAGVWTFGQYVNMLVPHGRVNDPWRSNAIAESHQINSVALRTNLGKALETASDNYYTHGDLSHTHFILLTDGKVDIADSAEINDRERTRVLDSVLAQIAGQGATIHAVALSEEADLPLLQAFAEQTQGTFTLARTAEELNKAFLQSLNAATPQEQIPIEGNEFLVDPGVKEFTALIFPGELSPESEGTLSLITPGGKKMDYGEAPAGVRWAHEPGYDLITVTEPPSGTWYIDGPLGQGSRVTVVSDLQLVLAELPSRFTEQEPVTVEAMFYQQGEPLTDQEFLKLIDVTLTLTSADGRSGTKQLSPESPPVDGVYRDEISNLPIAGEFTLDLVADGKTFARKYSQSLTYVVPEPVTVSGAASAPELADMSSDQEAAQVLQEPPQPPPEDIVPAPEPVIGESPIDITAVETPQVTGESHAESAFDGLLALLAGGVAIAGVSVGGFIFWKRRRQAEVPADELAAAAESGDASDEDSDDLPQLEEEPVDDTIVDTTTGVEPEGEDEPESEVAELDEEDPDENDESEEFGLEDFDLSEIDAADESDVPVEDDAEDPDRDRNG